MRQISELVTLDELQDRRDQLADSLDLLEREIKQYSEYVATFKKAAKSLENVIKELDERIGIVKEGQLAFTFEVNNV